MRVLTQGKILKKGPGDKGLSNYGPRTEKKKLIGRFGKPWTVVGQAWQTVGGKMQTIKQQHQGRTGSGGSLEDVNHGQCGV